MSKSRTLPLSDKVRKLKLYNEKVEVLRRSDFIQQITQGKHVLNLQVKPGSGTVSKFGPSENAMLAIVSTLRFFVQDRDGISLWQIAAIYETLDVEERAKQSVREAVASLDSFLDSNTNLVYLNVPVSNRQIFEVFMYGTFAHANEDKRAVYEQWTAEPAFGQFFLFEFEDIVHRMIHVIQSFYRLNQRTIQQFQEAIPER